MFGVATNQRHNMEEIRVITIGDIVLTNTKNLKSITERNDGNAWHPPLLIGELDKKAYKNR